MTVPPEMTQEQINLVNKVIADIGKLGLGALFAQYAIYANLYVKTVRDRGRGATTMRAEQLMPLVLILSQVFEIPTDRLAVLARALNDGCVRAAFQTKLAGKELIDGERAQEAMEWALRRMADGEYDN